MGRDVPLANGSMKRDGKQAGSSKSWAAPSGKISQKPRVTPAQAAAALTGNGAIPQQPTKAALVTEPSVL